MQLVRWNPFQEMVAMCSRPNLAFNDPYTPRTEASIGAWIPPVDIFEKDDHLVIRAEIPGIQKEDMHVGIENGVLTLHGERKHEIEVTEDNAHRLERICGMFTRSFTLPTTVDAANVTASYKDGVLEVTVPKIETAKPKKVEIKAG